MRDYVLRLLKPNGEPALIYRTQCQGDDLVLAKLLRIRSVRYASFEVWCGGDKKLPMAKQLRVWTSTVIWERGPVRSDAWLPPQPPDFESSCSISLVSRPAITASCEARKCVGAAID